MLFIWKAAIGSARVVMGGRKSVGDVTRRPSVAEDGAQPGAAFGRRGALIGCMGEAAQQLGLPCGDADWTKRRLGGGALREAGARYWWPGGEALGDVAAGTGSGCRCWRRGAMRGRAVEAHGQVSAAGPSRSGPRAVSSLSRALFPQDRRPLPAVPLGRVLRFPGSAASPGGAGVGCGRGAAAFAGGRRAPPPGLAAP